MKIPKRNGTRETLEDRVYNSERRSYMGMSSAGEKCTRKIFYGLHWSSDPAGLKARTKRIFNIGHLFERVIIEELFANGMKVYRVDGEGNEINLTGDPKEEQEKLIGFAGHELGHCDGRIIGVLEAPKTEHLLELKTMMQKYFLTVQKKGVKEAQPKHYAQMQRYMLSMKLERALYVAINKNTCELYLERIDFDYGFAEDLFRKARDVIMSFEPPAKHYPSGYFECNWCQHNSICHDGGKALMNCRTCEYSDMENEGIWTCSNKNNTRNEDEHINGRQINTDDQKIGCDFYKLGWGLENENG
tara:strand:- start:5236 stop:6141 length:906 start_codon:yes stop_codon:yes gene_type:complete